jgi:hypothetical protein
MYIYKYDLYCLVANVSVQVGLRKNFKLYHFRLLDLSGVSLMYMDRTVNGTNTEIHAVRNMLCLCHIHEMYFIHLLRKLTEFADVIRRDYMI